LLLPHLAAADRRPAPSPWRKRGRD